MFDEIFGILGQPGIKKVLIIDNEVDFCKIMEFYLSKKNFKVHTAYTLKDALIKIEEHRPDLIIADKHVHDNLKAYLNEKIDSITGYYPEIKFISANANAKEKEREGAVQYTLKKDYYKKDNYKKNYYKRPQSFWEKLVEYIKNLFK